MITIHELKTVAPGEIVTSIIDGDDTIAGQIILEAEQTIRSYLHHRYDTAAIFAATADNRHPLIMKLLKEVAIYHLYTRRSRDAVNEAAIHRYEYAMKQLKEIATGIIHPEGLPLANNTESSQVFASGKAPHDTHFY